MRKLHPDLLRQAQQLTDRNPDSLISVATANGTYMYVSPAHARVFGYTPHELIGQNYKIMTGSVDNFNNIRLTEIALTPEPVQMRFTRRAKSGRLIQIETSARAIFDPETGEQFILGNSTVVE